MFKMVMVLACNGVSGIVITDLPAKLPGLDGCAACVAAKLVHLLHKEGHGQASGYLDRVHVDLVSPIPAKSVGGQEYEYVTMDDYSCVVYTRPLCFESEAADIFKTFKAAVENESAQGYD